MSVDQAIRIAADPNLTARVDGLLARQRDKRKISDVLEAYVEIIKAPSPSLRNKPKGRNYTRARRSYTTS
ncbi:hypothetical protein N7475_004975 [Penicillium sp. IBT 31633x]|nr:hypothetical protein N7475_004975 [Penicillium sp. IBT 31633x]